MANGITSGNAYAGLYNIRSAAGTSLYGNGTGTGNNTKYVKAIQSNTNTLNENRAKFRLIGIKNEKANTNTPNISGYVIAPAYGGENNSLYIYFVSPFKAPVNDGDVPNLTQSELTIGASIPTICGGGLYNNGGSPNTISIINYSSGKEKNSTTGNDAFGIQRNEFPVTTNDNTNYTVRLKMKSKVSTANASTLNGIFERREDQYIRIDGHGKRIAQPYIKIDGAGKPVVATYVKIGGYGKMK